MIDKKLIQIMAYDLLLKHNINHWPIDPFEIVHKELELSPIPISVFETILQKNLDIPEDAVVGFAMYLLYEKHYGVIYNHKLPVSSSRCVITHEFGHIKLSHVSQDGKPVFFGGLDPIYEEEANYFAMSLLCPPCLIKFFQMRTHEEIALFFDIPLDIAKELVPLVDCENRGLKPQKNNPFRKLYTMDEEVQMSYSHPEAELIIRFKEEALRRYATPEPEHNKKVKKIKNISTYRNTFNEEYSEELCFA